MARGEQTAGFYNRFSFFYPLVDVVLKRQKRRLFEATDRLSPGKLLEIGVGNGAHLHRYKHHRVTGIDTSHRMLEMAAQQAAGVELLLMNGETLSFGPQTFDYVVLSHVLAVSERPEKMLDEIYRVLKPGGRLFILNHFTPANGLRYLDRALQPLSRLFHFRSVFRIADLSPIQKFRLLDDIRLDRFFYFRLLIYEKV